MIDLERARRELYKTMDYGKRDEILEASRKLDKHILRLMHRQQRKRNADDA